MNGSSPLSDGGRATARSEIGQAAVLLAAALCAILIASVVLGGVARGTAVRGDAQRAADLGALAGARAMLAAHPRLFVSPDAPGHLERSAYLTLGRMVALDVARRNGATEVHVGFPDGATIAPVRIRVRVKERVVAKRGGEQASTGVTAEAEAELSPSATSADQGPSVGGGYDGPLVQRQGRPMRPDVAMAFDRLAAAARSDGISLLVTSAFRSDAEQAVLWARRPDPRWVAPPGRSLHRNATELDLGPATAYAWLAGHAPRFGFALRYAWEPWHFGYTLNPRSRPVTTAVRPGRDDPDRAAGDGSSDQPVPGFVPPRFATAIARAAQRWNVSGTLLAAQLHAESGFNPFAVSSVGARGIAQFLPATARAYGLRDPLDPEPAIDAQAHLMRDLLRQFGSVPLALAAYNAGPGRVAACACIPPFPETRGYVARILGLMGGAGETVTSGGGAALAVRLVE